MLHHQFDHFHQGVCNEKKNSILRERAFEKEKSNQIVE
jgi:hypothetical protein